MKFIAILASAFLLVACGGGGGGDNAASPASAQHALSGQFQKGPFAIGSQVTANVLNGSLDPVGTVYNVQTSDDLGHFSVPSGVAGNLVELVGDGFYMDELTGQLSTSRIQLRAVVDLDSEPVVTVNILTSLQGLRLKKLISQGSSYAAAYAQSRNEVLSAFGIDPAKVRSLSSLSSMQITGSTDADSVLLAVSAILSKMATTAALANATSQPAELSNYVNAIASQIQQAGEISFTSYKTAISLAATQIDLAAVRSHVETYYAARGITVVAPKFEEWIDKDASTILPRRLVPATGLSFPNSVGAEPGQLITSNTVSVGGLGSGIAAPVMASSGASLIKNGAMVSANVSTVVDGDTLALRATSLGYGLATDITTISVGATSATWRVASKPLGGSITGLLGTGLVLHLEQRNSPESVTIAPGSTGFGFSTGLAIGTHYFVTVLSQPSAPAQACSVSNGGGTVSASTTASISLTCVAVTTTATGNLHNARAGHTSTLLANGKVLVVGGGNLAAYTNTAEIYDPATGVWTATGSLTSARGYHSATLLPGGKVLVTGGGSGLSGGIAVYLSSAELYDPATGIWTATGSLGTGRSLHTATLLPGGLILAVGGVSGTSGGANQFLSSAELYDPGSGMWTATGNLNSGRQLQVATLLANGKVLVAGGALTASAELYDPSSGTWAFTGAPQLSPYEGILSAQLANGKVLIASGGTTVQLYDPASGLWTMTGSLHTPKSGQFSLLPNGKVLAAGFGIDGTEIYDPTSGAWSQDGSIAVVRSGFSANLLPTGQVLITGGSGFRFDFLLGSELY